MLWLSTALTFGLVTATPLQENLEQRDLSTPPTNFPPVFATILNIAVNCGSGSTSYSSYKAAILACQTCSTAGACSSICTGVFGTTNYTTVPTGGTALLPSYYLANDNCGPVQISNDANSFTVAATLISSGATYQTLRVPYLWGNPNTDYKFPQSECPSPATWINNQYGSFCATYDELVAQSICTASSSCTGYVGPAKNGIFQLTIATPTINPSGDVGPTSVFHYKVAQTVFRPHPFGYPVVIDKNRWSEEYQVGEYPCAWNTQVPLGLGSFVNGTQLCQTLNVTDAFSLCEADNQCAVAYYSPYDPNYWYSSPYWKLGRIPLVYEPNVKFTTAYYKPLNRYATYSIKTGKTEPVLPMPGGHTVASFRQLWATRFIDADYANIRSCILGSLSSTQSVYNSNTPVPFSCQFTYPIVNVNMGSQGFDAGTCTAKGITETVRISPVVTLTINGTLPGDAVSAVGLYQAVITGLKSSVVATPQYYSDFTDTTPSVECPSSATGGIGFANFRINAASFSTDGKSNQTYYAEVTFTSTTSIYGANINYLGNIAIRHGTQPLNPISDICSNSKTLVSGLTSVISAPGPSQLAVKANAIAPTATFGTLVDSAVGFSNAACLANATLLPKTFSFTMPFTVSCAADSTTFTTFEDAVRGCQTCSVAGACASVCTGVYNGTTTASKYYLFNQKCGLPSQFTYIVANNVQSTVTIVLNPNLAYQTFPIPSVWADNNDSYYLKTDPCAPPGMAAKSGLQSWCQITNEADAQTVCARTSGCVGYVGPGSNGLCQLVTLQSMAINFAPTVSLSSYYHLRIKY